MNAVRTANGWRHFMLKRAAFDGGEQGVNIGEQQIGSTAHLNGERRIKHIR